MTKMNVAQTLSHADAHMRQGDLANARALYVAVLATFPENADAQSRLAKLDEAINASAAKNMLQQDEIDRLVAWYNQGKFQQMVEQADRLVSAYPSSPLLWNILAAGRQALGQLDGAIWAYERALKIQPAYPDAHNNMGNVLKEQGKFEEAIAAYRRALYFQPGYADAYFNMGNVLKAQGKLNEEIAAYRQAVALKPTHAEAYNNMGNALKDQGKLDEAIAAYRCALEIRPAYADVYYNMAVALDTKGDLDAAIETYQHSLEIRPGYADAYYNIGAVLNKKGEIDAAIAAYRRAIELRPAYSEAYYNLGNALRELGRQEESIEAYKSALAIKPTYAEAYNNMGNRLKDRGKLQEAIGAYLQALKHKPAYAEAYNNMGNALKDQGKLDEAIAAYRRAVEIKPSYAAAEAHLLFQCQHVCDWSGYAHSADASARLGIETDPVPPFALLSTHDSPQQQLARSEAYARAHYRLKPQPLPARAATRPARIKVGYFSADFHDHATLYLMAGLLRAHDHSQFEIFAYSYGPTRSGELRKRAEHDVDHFFEIADVADRQVVELARSHGLDIAIDLKGYTQNTRSEIFEHRLAPIQISYLGYPGSMGVDFMDYIIADHVVMTDEQRLFCSEKAIYLPHSYQPNDDARPIAASTKTRADFGLPEEAFVFCCFNNNYKIGPREFDIWMRLLSKVNKSVLWLLRSNIWAEQNLRMEAAKRGVAPERIIFAEKMSHYEHLARQRHADLFIDTFNYNAHTTASDALWGGLPVVTKKGEQFAACVAASLLSAINLPELITESEADYERLIVELATDPYELKRIKNKLLDNRTKAPLFDTERYTRNFERGLMQAYELYWQGKDPADIWVQDVTFKPADPS